MTLMGVLPPEEVDDRGTKALRGWLGVVLSPGKGSSLGGQEGGHGGGTCRQAWVCWRMREPFVVPVCSVKHEPGHPLRARVEDGVWESGGEEGAKLPGSG